MNSFFAYLCSFFFGMGAAATVDLSKPQPLISAQNGACLPGENVIAEIPLKDSHLIKALSTQKTFIVIPEGGTTIGSCGVVESLKKNETGYTLKGKLIERVRCLSFSGNTAHARAWPLSFNEKKHRTTLALLIIELQDEAAALNTPHHHALTQKFQNLLTTKPQAGFFIASLYARQGTLSKETKNELLEAPNLVLMLKMMLNALHTKTQEVLYPQEIQAALNAIKNELNATTSKSQEYGLLKKRLELIKQFPLTKESPVAVAFEDMKTILDKGHLGMKPLKERLLDYLAVMKMNPGIKVPILCLAGPAGVGKTTIAQSVARALGRPFYRISLGGLHDESLLRGSSPSYVGAQPGRIAMALIKTHSFAPLILLDEIDKVATQGGTNGGSPEAALLELLDQAQNDAFYDNYLGFDLDLSKVLFIATANDLKKLQKPLLDRMEIINVPGYSLNEKVEILKTIIIPNQCKEYNLDPQYLYLDNELIRVFVWEASKEAGIRTLQQTVRRICAKIARMLIEKKPVPALTQKYLLDLLKECV